MKLLKKAFTLIGGCLFVFGLAITPAKANNWEILNKAIIVAEKRFIEADKTLKMANSELYNDFIFHRWSEEFQIAEKKLRTEYPDQYNEYIKAKAELDELLELKNMATF